MGRGWTLWILEEWMEEGELGFGVERSVVREGWFQGRLSRALEVGIVSGRAE